MSSTDLEHWPTYASVLSKCTEEDNKMTYQCQELKNFSTAKSYYANHYSEYCSKITECVKSRLAWSDLQQLRDIIFVLASQGWQKALDESNSLEAIDRLTAQFSIPLQRAGAVLEEIRSEFDGIMQYASQFISLSVLVYHAVWWRVFHAPCAAEWSNALTLGSFRAKSTQLMDDPLRIWPKFYTYLVYGKLLLHTEFERPKLYGFQVRARQKTVFSSHFAQL